MPEAVVIERADAGANLPLEAGGNIDLNGQLLRLIYQELRVMNAILVEGLGTTNDPDLYRSDPSFTAPI